MSKEVVLSLTNARIDLGSFALEQRIADALSVPASTLTVVTDDGCTTIIVYPENEDDALDADTLAAKINGAIQRGEATDWVNCLDALCDVADDEESVYLEEEDAFQMWHDMSENDRTGHLDKVPNPDGALIQPSNVLMAGEFASPIESQLKRDPSLLVFDNVKRVHVSQIDSISWEEPIIITNAFSGDTFSNEGLLNNHQLAAKYGDVEVRTGNRETLIDNGITNSKPMQLAEALLSPNHENSTECGRIVFSPIRELPDDFSTEMRQFTDCFPSLTDLPEGMQKYTLTIASEGFGIGMHKHNAAMFMLLIGEKKWYMSSSEDLEGDDETHPEFYREKSSHKCIQQQGEILYVPNEWYHEIFNLEYTAGIQALPG